MHIVHINLSRECRGGELQTIALVEALSALGDDIGLEQTLVVRNGSRFHRHCADLRGFNLRPVRPSLIRAALAAVGADVVHVHEGRSIKVGALLSLIGVPFIVTRRVPNRPRDFFLTRWVYSRAASIVCVSNNVAEVMRGYTGPSRVATVYDCVRTLANTPDSKAPRPSDKLTVATVGQIDFAHKGQDLLVQAARHFCDEGADVEFLIVGTGKDEDNLITMTHSLGNVRFPGWVDDIAGLFSQVDVLVHPARKEGLGSVILEAMSTGTPVIAARVGGIPEIVEDGFNGLLIEPDSPKAIQGALSRILSDHKLRQRLSKNALITAMKFRKETMAGHYLNTYLDLGRVVRSHPA